MKRLATSVAAVVIALVVVEAAPASPRSGGIRQSGSPGTHHNYVVGGNGSRSVHGRFLDRSFRGWSHRWWSPSHSCYCYYCPEDSGWYYWYAPWGCYCPYSYIGTYPPTAVASSAAGTVTPPTGASAPPAGAGTQPTEVAAPAFLSAAPPTTGTPGGNAQPGVAPLP